MKMILEFNSPLNQEDTAKVLLDLAQGFQRKPYLLGHSQTFELYDIRAGRNIVVGSCKVVATDQEKD